MLAPGLATMLVVLTTDADVQPDMLDVVLRDATRVTFDRADSDGCMSTNDTVVLLASGASGAVPSAAEFGTGLTQVCAELARKLIGDAEGASHDIAIRTFNAASERDAEVVSRAVARSNLFKTAIFGKDPNWGRVLSAVGTTDAAFEPDQLNVSMNGVQICRNGSIGDDRNLVDLEPPRGPGRDRPAGRRGRGHDPGPTTSPTTTSTKTAPTPASREVDAAGTNSMNTQTRETTSMSDAQGQSRHADRGAALDPALRRHHHGDQVRRQRHGQRRAPPRLRRGRRLPAPRRHPPRGGARRRPADQRHAQPARHRIRVQGRAAGHHAGGHGRGPDGPHRPGGPRTRGPDQLPRPLRRRHVR